jgi:DNA-directed RNA polymerase subunit M/transcription elongation factor TFIIS
MDNLLKRFDDVEKLDNENKVIQEKTYEIDYDKLLEELCPSNNEQFKVKCRNKKCNSEKVFYQVKQGRSADEGMSVFFECDKCNERWKYR